MECVKHLLEDVIEDDLKILRDEQQEEKEREKTVREVCELADRLIEIRKAEMEDDLNKSKAKAEMDQKQKSYEIELEKVSLNWKKVTFETAKIVVPLAMQIVSFSILQRRTLEYEEHGTIRSFGSKEMHLPKFWK